MTTQSPSGPSRRTLIAFLTLYLLSIGTSLLFLSHAISNPSPKRTLATLPGKPVSTQRKRLAVVYFHNQTDGDAFLMLYNVSTGQKVQVLRIKNNMINYAQVSPDGQWILFIVGDWRTNGPYQLQMIRINGLQHEILYTFAPADYGSPLNQHTLMAQWSLDQKSIFISTDRDKTISTFSILDMKTRTVRTTLQITNAQYGYYPLKWLDKMHMFVLALGRYPRAYEMPPTRLYLLDVTARPAQRVRDLKLIVLGDQGADLKFDTSPDGRRLFVVQQVQGNLTIWVEPATGGKRQILLNLVGAYYSMYGMRVFTHYLLVTVAFRSTDGDTQHEMWRMPLDASNHTVLFSNKTDYIVYVLNRMTQYVSSNLSPGETMLALEAYRRDDSSPTLLVSPLPEVKAAEFEVFPFGAGIAFIVGWTTI